MRTSLKLSAIGALAGLGLAGCVAYPVGPDTYTYAPAPVPYYAPYYAGSVYYYGGPGYYGPRRYYGPRYYGGGPRYYGGPHGGPHYHGAPHNRGGRGVYPGHH